MLGKIMAFLSLALVGAVAAVATVTNHSYVTTPSMYPTIPPGSMIFVHAETSYHVGEVIEFHANGLTWAHRLVKINADGTFVTKGDNPANSTDMFVPALTEKDVVGVVTHAPRWIGFPELIAHHPSYGLSWLRAELGFGGKLAVTLAVALMSFVPVWKDRRRAEGASAEIVGRGDAGAADVRAPGRGHRRDRWHVGTHRRIHFHWIARRGAPPSHRSASSA